MLNMWVYFRSEFTFNMPVLPLEERLYTHMLSPVWIRNGKYPTIQNRADGAPFSSKKEGELYDAQS